MLPKLSARSGPVSQITQEVYDRLSQSSRVADTDKACGVSPWRPRLEIEESTPQMECGKCRGDSPSTLGPDRLN